MDLYAYAQIEKLNRIMTSNRIDIPRLRGLRLMKDEELVSRKKILEIVKDLDVEVVEDLCQSSPFWNPKAFMYSRNSWTDYLVKYYISGDKWGDEKRFVRWNRIHGWKRRIAKFEIKKLKRKIQQQYDTFNKYVGRDDVMMVHARIGGNNWDYFRGDETVANQPWFLEKVDDWWDSTYCDIYVKIYPDAVKAHDFNTIELNVEPKVEHVDISACLKVEEE